MLVLSFSVKCVHFNVLYGILASCSDGEVRESQSGRGDWRCVLVGGGALSVVMDGHKPTLKFSAMILDMSLTQVHYSWLHLAMPAHYRQRK